METLDGSLSLLDGSITGPPPNAVSATQGTLPRAKGVVDTALGPVTVFWDSGRFRLGYRNTLETLVELNLRSSKILRRLTIPVAEEVFGDPDTGHFTVGFNRIGTGRQVLVQNLVLMPLRISPLKFFYYYDLVEPERGVLGTPVPAGQKISTLGQLSYTPNRPLACGNPYSGKVMWVNPDADAGFWLGAHWVVARLRDDKWHVLNGKTGKDTGSILPELDGSDPSQIQAVGNYLLRLDRSDYRATCFKVAAHSP